VALVANVGSARAADVAVAEWRGATAWLVETATAGARAKAVVVTARWVAAAEVAPAAAGVALMAVDASSAWGRAYHPKPQPRLGLVKSKPTEGSTTARSTDTVS